MSDDRAGIPSVIERTRPVAAGAPVVGVHFIGDTVIFVLGEEALLFVDANGERRVPVHGGGILTSACDGRRVVTGGDDGKVMATGADGARQELAADEKSRWIDHVALSRDGAVAWSAGKTAFARAAKGELRQIDAPSTVAGLAFAPKGFRLAIAHYNGATLWFPNATGAAPELLEWKGSHVGVAFSPDGRFLVTAMQEPMLHGWRLADSKHMRMSGYSARVRSFDWTGDGGYLATSGSEQLVLWPFQGKDGPMGKQPAIMARAQSRIAVVACHPRQPVVAAGFGDGMVLLVKIDDGAEVLARAFGGGGVSALGWDSTGSTLAFGTDDGDAAVLTL